VTLQSRLQDVENRLAEACLRSGRQRDDVQIIAVTKYVSVQTAEAAVNEGISHIGENRWPDAKEKWEKLKGQAIFHYIGSLQTKKVKDIINKFDYIHSLDRLTLAEEIQNRALVLDIHVDCFLQVNVSGEQTKHGLPPEQLITFIQQIQAFDRIRLIGLMTMAPYESEPEETRPIFRRLRELRDEINESGILREPLIGLSMGMSNDFEVAVEEGATHVRLGTVLVGKQELEEG
jgi:pyridoxal phosphate enzyme (YggS family)